jgi:putative acetyltransferase
MITNSHFVPFYQTVGRGLMTTGKVTVRAESIEVRREQIGDEPGIRRVVQAAFEQPAEAELVDALRANERVTLSLVAVEAGEVIGHILFSPVSLEGGDELRSAGLAPLAVAPEHQRTGIGSALVTRGLKELREAGFDAVVVLGHAKYYPRFGFVPAGRFGLRSEYDVADDVFMAQELRAGALAKCRGLVMYQPEFREF